MAQRFEMTEKHKQMCRVFFRTGNRTEAAKAAGFTRQGVGKMLKRKEIQDYLEQLRNGAEMTPVEGVDEEIVDGMMSLARNAEDEGVRLRALVEMAKIRGLYDKARKAKTEYVLKYDEDVHADKKQIDIDAVISEEDLQDMTPDALEAKLARHGINDDERLYN